MDKERIFWQAVRRALLMIVAAIDERYDIGKAARQRSVQSTKNVPRI